MTIISRAVQFFKTTFTKAIPNNYCSCNVGRAITQAKITRASWILGGCIDSQWEIFKTVTGARYSHTSSSTRSQPSSSASLDTSSILSRATPSPTPCLWRFIRGRDAGFAVVAWRSWAKSSGNEGGVGSGIFGYVSWDFLERKVCISIEQSTETASLTSQARYCSTPSRGYSIYHLLG